MDKQVTIKKSKPFILGFCNCRCGEEIPVRGKHGDLQRFKHTHASRGENNGKWKGGIRYNLGYKMLKRSHHPNCDPEGYVREHRLIMEYQLGRLLKTNEDVHHISEDILDNSIENLQLLTKSEHTRIHNKGNKYGKKDMIGRFCLKCGSNTTRFRNDRNSFEWYKLDSGFLCSKCYSHKRRMIK